MIPYQTVRSSRKTIAVQVARDGTVTVRAPRFTTAAQIEAFVKLKSDWIEKVVEEQKLLPDFSAIDKETLTGLKRTAVRVIPPRVAYYSRLMGLKPSAVRINAAKTRFGSCSGKNSLNFSAFLMLYPERAVDYVVVHELAHIRHHNHSKSFYHLIERYLPDYRQRRQLLRQAVALPEASEK